MQHSRVASTEVREGTRAPLFRSLCRTVAFASVLVQVGLAHAQQSGCGTNPFQDWYYIHPSLRFVTLQGTIAQKIHLNVGDWFDDGDWNIHVKPFEGSYLVNNQGRANANGLIELEVNSRGTPGDMAARFPVGTVVEANGAWVRDTGHNQKTELHPVEWIRTVNTNPVNLFVAQDDTGRFVNAELVLWEPFDFPLTSSYPKVTPWYIPPSQTQMLEESAKVARGTTRGELGPESYRLWVFLDSWWFSNCEVIGQVTYGDSPYYFGTMTRSTVPLLKETVTYSVATDIGTGQKIAMIKVAAELETLPQAEPYEGEPGIPPGGLAYSKWRYESTAGTVVGTLEETKTGPHRFEFSMPYAPAIGYNQNTWQMTVTGSSVPYASTMPAESKAQARQVSRIMISEGRTYALDKSTISLKWERKAACTDPIYLTVDESKLLPQIGIRGIRWFVTIERDGDGFSVTNPVEAQVAPQSPLDTPGFTASTYPSPNDKRLDVAWKPLPSGLPNLSRLAVTVRAVTELGEEADFTLLVTPNCGIGGYSFAQIVDFSARRIHKAGYDGEWYRAAESATSEDKPWIEALWKFMDGRRLTKEEERLVLSGAAEGADLPPPPEQESLTPIPRRERLPTGSPIVIPTTSQPPRGQPKHR